MTLTPLRHLSAPELADLLAAGGSAVIDVREPGEYASGHIAGSRNGPPGSLTESLLPDGPLERFAGAPLPLMRQVQITAGSLVLLGLTLATFVAPAWILLSWFAGAGLVFAGFSGFCGLALLLARLPWNRA